MISIGKVRSADYYLAEVGRDDASGYYVDTERVGRWHGRLAADLGLSGRVDPDDFRAVLEGLHPDRLARLTEHPTQVKALSVPKSVSIAWALGDHDSSRQVERALDEAQAAVIELLEAEASFVRRGHGGLDVQRGSGLLVASFDHRTSRLGDPNLHRNLVVANASRGPDGRITGLDTRQLYRIRYTAEAVFQAVLRHELAHDPGFGFGRIDRHGVGEIDGVSHKVRRAFSQRRREIEAEMIWQGATTGHGARIATLATRRPKDRTLSDDEFGHRWHARARELGFDPAKVRTESRVPVLSVTDEELAGLVTEQEATYRHNDVIRAVCRSAGDGARVDAILEHTDQYVASGQAVERLPGVYTTPEILALETHAADIATHGRSTGIGLASDTAIGAALRARPRLAGEQRRLIERVAGSGDSISLVVGQAGAGKTTALDGLRDAYHHDGYTVLGTALSARAAAELQSGAGIPSQTVHRITSILDAGRPLLDDRTALIVDEAAMVGTRHLARLIDATHRARAKLVLVGDPRQLPEIDAGGTFAAIAHRIPPVRLTENRRQTDPHQRAALTALRHIDIDHALSKLERAHNLTTGPDTDTVRTALVADWHAAVTSGHHAIMLASRRGDVADLNQRARQQLHLAGTLGPPVWNNDTTSFSIGERVIAHRNRHDLGLLNGQHVTVTGATDTALTIRTDHGANIAVPNRYIDAGHLTHGYALTVHKAQGMTCDVAYFLGDDSLYNELAYTGLSRGRHTNHLYTVAARDEHHRLLTDPHTHLRRTLAASRAKTAAIDTGIDGPSLP